MDLLALAGRAPPENLRVSRASLASIWQAAAQKIADDSTDWFSHGVASTCAWLACAPAEAGGTPTRAPVTERSRRAMPETIGDECAEVDRLIRLQPTPNWLSSRPGWLDGVRSTLDWAWRRTGPPPLDVDR